MTRLYSRVIRFFLAGLLLFVFFIPTISVAETKRSVLYISSYHPGFPTFFQQVDGIKSVLGDTVLFDIEFMDTKRYPRKENREIFQKSLAHKLGRSNIYDVIIVADDNALMFALDQQEKLFKGKPIVFLGVNDIDTALAQNSNPGVTGVVESVSMKETIELMIRLRPEAKQIIAISDGTSSGQADLKLFYQTAEAYSLNHFKDISLAKMNWDDFLTSVGRLGEESAVLLLSAYQDKNNDSYLFDESLRLIRERIQVPVFHLWYHGLGQGILGGKIISHYEQGRVAASIVQDILAGKPVNRISVVEQSPNKYVFDHFELEKFNIDKSLLPENSIILNTPKSFYRDNSPLIWKITAAIIILILALFIAVVNIIKRINVEKSLERLVSDLKHQKKILEQTNSERQKAQKDAEESAEYFHMLFNLMPFSCVIYSLNEEILLANTHFCETVQEKQEQVVGKTLKAFGRAIDPEDKEKLIAELMAKGSVQSFETKIHWDGHESYVLLTSCRLINWQGEKAILTSSLDITDRIEAEKTAIRNAELLREAERTAKVGAWSADFENRSLIWSDEMGRIHDEKPGYTPVWDESQKFIAPEWREKISEVYGRCISDGVRIDEEFGIITAKGRRRWVRATGEAVADDSGKIIRITGALQDISDRKQAEDERKALESYLAQARKMEAIGNLAGGIAHDFNNILSGIMGFTDLAMFEAGENEKLKKYLNQVASSSLRARDLVKHILTFSRKSDAAMQPVGLNAIIKETLKFIRASLPANIDIRHNLKIEDEQVLGDSTQIHQILMNLFTNAGYAMKEKGGVLDVALDKVTLGEYQNGYFGKMSAGEYLRLTISDTGSGIPPKIIDRIFEPFFTTKEREEGTGMGLSTVYGILKEMGGGISVYSEEGVGTTFKILLPEHLDGGEQTEENEQELKSGRGNILIIDDEALIVESTSELLTKLGYSVTGETDSHRAVEAVKNNPEFYDLILTDMMMQSMDGLELAKQIGEINPDISIVLSTGFCHGLTMEKCKSAGIKDMVMKPMIASELSSTVDRIMNEKK